MNGAFNFDILHDVFLLVTGGLITWLIEYVRDLRSERVERSAAKRTTSYSWETVYEGADKVGAAFIKRYKPDAIFTFAGGSAIFANLTLVRSLSRKDVLSARIYTCQFLGKDANFIDISAAGNSIIESERFSLSIPSLLDLDRTSRICVIDDTCTTGSSMRSLKDHLVSIGFAKSNIRTCCFVAYSGIRLLDPTPLDFACEWAETLDYRLPWGKRL